MNVCAATELTLRGLSAAGLMWSAAAAADESAAASLWRMAQANPCAIYGSGYVTVHGGAECAQIRGRVRLEPEAPAGAMAVQPEPEPGFAPAIASPPEASGRALLRLPAAQSYAPDAPRTR